MITALLVFLALIVAGIIGIIAIGIALVIKLGTIIIAIYIIVKVYKMLCKKYKKEDKKKDGNPEA